LRKTDNRQTETIKKRREGVEICRTESGEIRTEETVRDVAGGFAGDPALELDGIDGGKVADDARNGGEDLWIRVRPHVMEIPDASRPKLPEGGKIIRRRRGEDTMCR